MPPIQITITTALWWLGSIALCITCVWLAWKHVARIKRATLLELREEARALRKIEPDRRVAHLAGRAAPGTWEARFATELEGAAPGPGRVAIANELLADFEHELTVGSRWPTSALRIGAAGQLLLAITAFLAGAGWPAYLGVAVVGFAGFVACLIASSQASSAAARQRDGADSLVAAVLPDEPSERTGETKPRRRWS